MELYECTTCGYLIDKKEFQSIRDEIHPLECPRCQNKHWKYENKRQNYG